MPTDTPTLAQLQRALALAEQIQKLEAELQAVMSGTESENGKTTRPAAAPKPGKPGRKPFSAETKAKMAAAQQARWAAKKGTGTGAAAPAPVKPGKKGKRKVSPEVRARLAAAMKARWAAAKKKGLPGPNARK